MATNAMEMEKMEIGSSAKKISIKKIIIVLLALLLAANICATIIKNRGIVSRAELEQLKTSVLTLQQDVATMKASLEDLKKTSESLARAEYEGFKAELGILSSLVEEMGKNIPE